MSKPFVGVSPPTWTHTVLYISAESETSSSVTVTIVVIVENGAQHYSTRTERGSDIGFSSCTVPTSYSCLSILGVFWEFQGFQKCQKWSGSSEVIQNWSIVQRERGIEVIYEARSLE